MKIEDQIKNYISSQSDSKSSDMQLLHEKILKIDPGCRLWFLDGKNEENKTVSNPNIGYGIQTIKYTDGKTKEFYQIGMSANTTGISIYILGIADKKFLADNYGKDIGRAGVTSYCIKFKSLKDINVGVLETAIRYGFDLEKIKAK